VTSPLGGVRSIQLSYRGSGARVYPSSAGGGTRCEFLIAVPIESAEGARSIYRDQLAVPVSHEPADPPGTK
jgi:hypothetical protein